MINQLSTYIIIMLISKDSKSSDLIKLQCMNILNIFLRLLMKTK